MTKRVVRRDGSDTVARETDQNTHPSTSELGGDGRYLNRELSRLDYMERVLALAADDSRPPLDRAKFLAIFAQNLDEFFQIRVAGLKEQFVAGIRRPAPDGRDPEAQLEAIRHRTLELVEREGELFNEGVAPRLAAGGVYIADWNDLKKTQQEELEQVFHERIYPVLTPLAVDPAHPFPYISDLSLNLAVVVRDPATGTRRFARVKVPQRLPRFVKVPGGRRFVPLEQVIAAHLDRLFPGVTIVAHHVFRVTRDADIDIEVEEADDLLETLESLLNRRQQRPDAVRLEVASTMPTEIRKLLLRELQLSRNDLYEVAGLLDLSSLWQLVTLNRPALKEKQWLGVTPAELGGSVDRADVFKTLQQHDVLVHHPYDRFATSVEAFVREAADDPDVLAIKQTLYRTSDDGEAPIVHSLVHAAATGKEVVCLVEVTARGDEEANIAWARTLEKAGVHVLYGVVGLKTHAKVVLVVRQESDAIRLYCHVGTGNYNPATATIYEDAGLLSADPELAGDVAALFNHLTGYAQGKHGYSKILVAPGTLRPRLLELIREEAAAGDGRIVMKMNALIDPELIDALYAASAAGTRIDLIVRGMCSLRPGVPGLSENIRVRSIVGRYLEHSRIFRFGSDARERRYFIGSADLMQRNLDRRVECVAPVTDSHLTSRLDTILEVNLEDDVLAWELGPEGWFKVPTVNGINTHDRLQELAEARALGTH